MKSTQRRDGQTSVLKIGLDPRMPKGTTSPPEFFGSMTNTLPFMLHPICDLENPA